SQIPVQLDGIQEIAFANHVVVRIQGAWIPSIVRNIDTIDGHDMIWFRLGGSRRIETPQLPALRSIFFIAQTAFLDVHVLLVWPQYGPIHGALFVQAMAEIPAQDKTVNSIAVLRVAFFDDLQPDQ